jgi:CBS domain-containing protein
MEIITPESKCISLEATGLMEKSQIRRLPVLNHDKQVVGIVSIGDLAARTHQGVLVGRSLAARG